jgi:hypothetical protein
MERATKTRKITIFRFSLVVSCKRVTARISFLFPRFACLPYSNRHVFAQCYGLIETAQRAKIQKDDRQRSGHLQS